MDPEHRAEMEAILRGDAPFTWEAWGRRVYTAPSLTDTGRRCVLESVDAIAAHLRVGWLDRFHSPGLPLLSMQWWLNDAPHVYARILEFGLRLRLLGGTPGFGKLRKAMANDPGSFRHAMLQIEVAALALQDGWAVTLEPDTDSGRGDVLVEKPGDVFLVEVKCFDLDRTTDTQMIDTSRLSEALRTIEWTREVSITGEISAVSAEQSEAWERLVCGGAERALHRREPVEVLGPTGVLTVHPIPHMEGRHFAIEIRHGNEWARVLTAIDAKAHQARSGQVPAWLRFDESTLFWALQIPDHPLERVRCLAAMTASLRGATRSHTNVGGVVLSSTPSGGGPISNEWWTTVERGIYLALTTNPPYFRETLIAPATHSRSDAHRDVWRRWYLQEPTWLEWAMNNQDLPPLQQMFTGDGIEPYLASRSSMTAR